MLKITLNKKGGIAKTTLSAILAEHLISKNIEVLCVDLDPENDTLCQYEPLNATHIQIKDKDTQEINRGSFDKLLEIVLENKDKDIIVDCGTTAYSALVNYLMENDFFEIMEEENIEHCIVGVVAGGGNARDSITGLNQVHENFPNTDMLVIKNELLGSLFLAGKEFEEMKTFNKIKNDKKLLGTISITKQADYIQEDIVNFTKERLLFSELNASELFSTAQTRRLQKYRNNLFSQLDDIFFKEIKEK